MENAKPNRFSIGFICVRVFIRIEWQNVDKNRIRSCWIIH